jgi:hypothetical protein
VVDSPIVKLRIVLVAAVMSIAHDAAASGHGPVFGAATPTLGRGGWSIDQAFTLRRDDESRREHMFKTMVSFGITEIVQVSGSIPILMSDNALPAARMMSPMSNDREFEGLVAYRFQRKPIGIGGRRESTLYVGGSIPFESTRNGVGAGGSLVLGAATGYASRAHYVWAGGGLQHYFPSAGDQLGDSVLVTFVYGYRPPPLRVDAGKPDLRFFVETTAEDRQADRMGTIEGTGTRTVFVGPTSLLVYKAIALEAGILFPAYQGDNGSAKEGPRVAVNFAYFFWLK